MSLKYRPDIDGLRTIAVLPALFMIIFASIPLAWLKMLHNQMEDFAQSILTVLFFVSNIYFGREGCYFGARAKEMPLLHTWSLAVQEQIYVFFPLLIMLVFWLSRRHILHVLVRTSRETHHFLTSSTNFNRTF